MTFTLWKKRLAWIFLAAAVFLIALLSSQHRIRLIAGSFETVDSCADLDSEHSLRYLTHSTLSQAPAFSTAVATLSAFDKAYPLLPGDALPTLDDPDTCLRRLEKGYPLHCYNVDIAATVILARQSIPSRLWDLNGPRELGGDGHNLLGVYDGVSHSWKAIDPYYHCYFILKQDSLPLDIPQLRLALLKSPEIVRLVRYSDTAGDRPDSNIIAELKYLAPGAILHANNDFRWRYDHRYGWLTPIAAAAFDGLPLRTARGVRTVMLGGNDKLYVIEDRFSPHFPFTLMKAVFWTLVLIIVFSAIGLITAWSRPA